MARSKKTTLPGIYEIQAEICAALANPVRIQLLDILSEGEKNCSEILELLPVSKANLSQHISVLKSVGILQARREGLYQYVSLALPQIKDACSLIRSVLAVRIEQQEKAHKDLKRELLKGAK